MITYLAHRAVSAGKPGDHVGNPPYLAMRVGDREAERYGAHQRQIGQVIADAGTGVGRDFEPCTEPRKRGELVPDALMQLPHAELAAARPHRRRAAAGNYRYLDTGPPELRDTVAIVHVERLERFAARTKIQPAIGQHAVDVEHQKANGVPHACGGRAC